MANFTFKVNDQSNQLKFMQLVEAITESIGKEQLKQGDMLPSVNLVIKEYHLSRDTVFKAYAELKRRGLIESVPNRGYFVAKNQQKVFLFLDTFKAYKEVLYASFLNHLPKDFSVDLHFHHYNIDVFEKIISESLGKYSKYIIMNFDHPRVPKIVEKIDESKLLIIDWKIHSKENQSTVYQDFGEPVYTCLSEHIDKIKKYDSLTFWYPDFTYHPKEAIDSVERFCRENSIPYHVISHAELSDIKRNSLFFLVSDRTLARFLDLCSEQNFEPGKDIGVISYNETPMKKYVKSGITVISTDFELMGQKAAEFVGSKTPVQFKVPTRLTIRDSI